MLILLNKKWVKKYKYFLTQTKEVLLRKTSLIQKTMLKKILFFILFLSIGASSIFAFNYNRFSAAAYHTNIPSGSENLKPNLEIKLNNNEKVIVGEFTPKETEIGTLTSTGFNSLAYRYSLISGTGSEDNSKFIIDGNKLKLNFVPDYEKPKDRGDVAGNNTYSIRIKAEDNNGKIIKKNFIIYISSKKFYINENSPVDSVVANLTIRDVYEKKGEIKFELIDWKDKSFFWIDRDQLKINFIPDYEKRKEYFIKIKVSDDQSSFIKEFKILVKNSDENPKKIILSNKTINESLPIGTEIGKLTAENDEIYEGLSYSLTCQKHGEDDSNFKIKDNILKSAVFFDYELPSDLNKNNQYKICIRVTDEKITNSNAADDEGEKVLDKNFIISVKNLVDSDAEKCKDHDMHGFAWSSNIGWISFDCKSAGSNIDYGVDVDRDGNLSGFAWSDSVGWIKFNYYEENLRAKYNSKTKKLEGFVKALKSLVDNGDGWNGKILLAGKSVNGSSYGPSYNLNNYQFSGYSWGDKIIGWINFNTLKSNNEIGGVVTKDPFYFRFSANAGTDINPVVYKGPVELSWVTSNAKKCTASGGEGTTWTNIKEKSLGDENTATEIISNLTSDKTFTLTCVGEFGGEIVKTVSLRVMPPTPLLSLSVDNNNISFGGKTTLNWSTKNVTNCQLLSDTGGPKNLNSTDGSHSIEIGPLRDATNRFVVKCDSKYPRYYPDGISKSIVVDVEKLIMEFYSKSSSVKFSDKIEFIWKTDFAKSCLVTGNLNSFNGQKSVRPGRHNWKSVEQKEPKVYSVKMKCIGKRSGEKEKEVKIRVGRNPSFQEI